MKRLILLVSACVCTLAAATTAKTTVAQAIRNPDGSPFQGSVSMALNANCSVADGTFIYAGQSTVTIRSLQPSSITVSSNTATVVTAAAHGLSVGATVLISGAASDTDLNTAYTVATAPTATTFTVTTASVTDGKYTDSTLRWTPGFSVQLYPNSVCTPAGTSYRVEYTPRIGGPSRPAEFWVVTDSTPTTIDSVRTAIVPTPSLAVSINQLSQSGATNGQWLQFSTATGLWTPATFTGLANPMTSVGDLIYGGTSGAASRLAGNTSTNLQLLSQTGTGSASQAPVWLNALSTNTGNSVVVRDGSGNFSAGTITAALTGNASTATALAANPTDCSTNQFANAIDASGNLTCVALTLAGAQFANQGTTTTVLHGNASGNPSFGAVNLASDVTGTLPNGSTTATSTNTASAIVSRDASGNFAAGTITASLTGNVTGDVTGNVTGSSGTVTSLSGHSSTELSDTDTIARRNAGNTWTTGTQDMRSATATLPMKTGTTLPATCTVGEMFYKTNVTAGQNLYGCTATNTWNVQAGGGAGGLSDPGAGGMVARTALNTTTARTVTGTSNEITVTDGDGQSGNPTLSLADTFSVASKTSTIPTKTGTSLPGTCSVGERYFKTDATAGQNDYGCTASNTWTLMSGGGGASAVTQADEYDAENAVSVSAAASGRAQVQTPVRIHPTTGAITSTNTNPTLWTLKDNTVDADAPGADKTAVYSVGGILKTRAGEAGAAKTLAFADTDGDAEGESGAYGAGWDGDTSAPTKDAVYDKIETIGGGAGDIEAVGDCSTGSCFASATANTVLAGPASGAAAAASMRALVAADMPSPVSAGVGYWLTPAYPGEHTTNAAGTIGEANRTYCSERFLPFKGTFNRFGFEVETAATSDQAIRFVLWDAAGTTSLWDSGALVYGGTPDIGSTGAKVLTITSTALSPGFYYLCWTADATTVKLRMGNDSTAYSSANSHWFFNSFMTADRVGRATASTGSGASLAFDATRGTVTGNSDDYDKTPIVVFWAE